MAENRAANVCLLLERENILYLGNGKICSIEERFKTLREHTNKYY